MNHTKFVRWLADHDACSASRIWVRDHAYSEDEAWAHCERGDWMLWLAARRDCAHVQIVRAACECARLVLHLVPECEDRPRLAIEAAEAWCDDPTAAAAANAAHAADYAYAANADYAYAADYAADAADARAAANAADAAYAAANAADAAYAAAHAADAADAAYAAAYAADAANAADYAYVAAYPYVAYAYKDTQQKTAEIVRRVVRPAFVPREDA